MSNSEKLGSKLHANLISTLSVLMVILTIIALCIPIHYNHWVGWLSRILFLAFSAVIAVLVIVILNDTFEVGLEPEYFTKYWRNLALVAGCLALEFFIAGITVHIKTDCWDVRSGRLAEFHGVRWDNPLRRTTVLLRKIPTKCLRIRSAIVPGRVIEFNISGQIALGTPVETLLEKGYIGSSIDDIDENNSLVSGTDITAGLETATDVSLLKCGATAEEIINGVPESKQRKFFRILREEAPKQLPRYTNQESVGFSVVEDN